MALYLPLRKFAVCFSCLLSMQHIRTVSSAPYIIRSGVLQGGMLSLVLFHILNMFVKKIYRVGQIKRGQLTFLLVTSERIYKVK